MAPMSHEVVRQPKSLTVAHRFGKLTTDRGKLPGSGKYHCDWRHPRGAAGHATGSSIGPRPAPNARGDAAIVAAAIPTVLVEHIQTASRAAPTPAGTTPATPSTWSPSNAGRRVRARWVRGASC